MLKNDMRNCLIQEKTFDQFIEEFGDSYRSEFSMDTMQKCWVNTIRLIPDDEWAKYLKNKAARYVGYLRLIDESMKEASIDLLTTRAGGKLKEMLSSLHDIDI